MGYRYENERPKLFTEEGQRDFLKVRDEVDRLLRLAGAVQMGKLLGIVSGDSWVALARIDRLVELGELREVTGSNVAGQDRVFVRATEGGNGR